VTVAAGGDEDAARRQTSPSTLGHVAAQERFSRSAKLWVKLAGMCWVTTSAGIGREFRKDVQQGSTRRWTSRWRWRRPSLRNRRAAGRLGASLRGRILATAAALTFSASSEKGSGGGLGVGLPMQSKRRFQGFNVAAAPAGQRSRPSPPAWRRSRHDLFQEFEAVHVRHLDIQSITSD